MVLEGDWRWRAVPSGAAIAVLAAILAANVALLAYHLSGLPFSD
jgi:hypothetical protein